MRDDDIAPHLDDYFRCGAAQEDMMYQIACEDAILHTAENGYECDDADCICHWERVTAYEEEAWLDAKIQAAQLDETGTHAPNCRCAWCSAEEF